MSSRVVPVACGTPGGKIGGKIVPHGRRRFSAPLGETNATFYRPFVLDVKVPYDFRFTFTGERRGDDFDDDSSGGGGGGGSAASGAGEDLYWKVVKTGVIAKSVRVGEGDVSEFVTLKIQRTGSRTGGMAPREHINFARSEVEQSTREEYRLATNAAAEHPPKAPAEPAAQPAAKPPLPSKKRGGTAGRRGGGAAVGGGGGGGGGDGDSDGDGGTGGGGPSATADRARSAILEGVALDAEKDGDTRLASLASKAAAGKKPAAAKKPGKERRTRLGPEIDQEYQNRIHELGTDFVIAEDTPAHATTVTKTHRKHEMTHRTNLLERIKAHGKFFVAGLGKENVRIRFSLVLCVRPPPPWCALPRTLPCGFRRRRPSETRHRGTAFDCRGRY